MIIPLVRGWVVRLVLTSFTKEYLLNLTKSFTMPLCGPKLSLCGVIISIWGIIQLVLMGLFYYSHAVALIEDLPIEEHYNTPKEFYSAAEKGYSLNAYNCWIAACLYVFTLIVSGHQFYMNSRTSL